MTHNIIASINGVVRPCTTLSMSKCGVSKSSGELMIISIEVEFCSWWRFHIQQINKEPSTDPLRYIGDHKRWLRVYTIHHNMLGAIGEIVNSRWAYIFKLLNYRSLSKVFWYIVTETAETSLPHSKTENHWWVMCNVARYRFELTITHTMKERDFGNLAEIWVVTCISIKVSPLLRSEPPLWIRRTVVSASCTCFVFVFLFLFVYIMALGVVHIVVHMVVVTSLSSHDSSNVSLQVLHLVFVLLCLASVFCSFCFVCSFCYMYMPVSVMQWKVVFRKRERERETYSIECAVVCATHL